MDKIYEICIPILFNVGIIFIIVGLLMYKFPPKSINSLYGYRTASSMQSQTKWDFAQKYSAKLMSLIGLGLFIISFSKSFLPFNEEQNIFFGMGVFILSTILLIVIVERKLKTIS